MDILEKLQLGVDAVAIAVNADHKFFAAVMHYVKQLQALAHAPRPETTQEDFQLLATKIEEFFAQWRPSSGDPSWFPPPQTSDIDSTVRDINQLTTELAKMETSAFQDLITKHSPTFQATMQHNGNTAKTPCIFIGHGHSKLWARVKVFLDELHIPTVTYESESRVGESIVPVLEKMLDQATFAVLILTAEDETASGELRARQNVIHEAGLFQGRLGFKKAVLLRQKGLENFSNVDGLQDIRFSGDDIEHTFYQLERVLKREKVI
jgi:predicted nucleotide-binding protein